MLDFMKIILDSEMVRRLSCCGDKQQYSQKEIPSKSEKNVLS